MKVIDVNVRLVLHVPVEEGLIIAGEELIIAGVGLVKVAQVNMFTDTKQHVTVQVLDRKCDFRETVRQMRMVALGGREWWR